MSILNAITQVVPLTQFQRDTKRLYDTVYRNILVSVFDPKAPVSPNSRFPTRKAAEDEAWACARLHAGLLPQNSVFRIVDDAANDPWKDWRGNANSTNPDVRKKASVSTFVVRNDDNSVYDHRVRYVINEPWATRLGFLNPIFTWNTMGAPEENPYKGLKNAAADKYYNTKGVLKNRNGYVPNV